MKMHHNKSLTMKVLLGLVVASCFLPPQAGAQTSINAFNSCVAGLGASATVADAAMQCIPAAGCTSTTTMSEESAQPACTLRDGTRLPRVIFSCAGPAANLRFRPSFSLCTLGTDFTKSIINHIEMGEDVNQIIDHDRVAKDADIDMLLKTFSLDTAGNSLGCNDCHDLLGHIGTGPSAVSLFRPILPVLAEGTIATDDPSVQKPATNVAFSSICAGITTELAKVKNKQALTLASKLCIALEAKVHY